jgi:hypothetical protein
LLTDFFLLTDELSPIGNLLLEEDFDFVGEDPSLSESDFF